MVDVSSPEKGALKEDDNLQKYSEILKKHVGPQADLKLHIHQLHPAAAAAAAQSSQVTGLEISRFNLRKGS